MVTAAKLEAQTSRELAQLAKSEGVRGWHAMRKAELVQALLERRAGESNPSSIATASSTQSHSASTPKTTARAASSIRRATKKVSPNRRSSESKVAKLIRAERQRQENRKDLSVAAGGAAVPEIERNRVVLIVRDAWWMQAYWEVTRQSVQRARVALAQHWHTAQPTLRLFEVNSEGNTNAVEQVVQDIPVSGDARNWFVNVATPDRKYRVALGYLTIAGQFHQIARSNEVKPPAPTVGSVDDNWADIADDAKHFFALSGGRDPALQSSELQAVFADQTGQSVGYNAAGAGSTYTADLLQQPLNFNVDAHMVVHGSTAPMAIVTIGGQPVRVQADGSFAQRVNLPERRQVLPVVASTRDGSQQRTTVLAIERNTKDLGLVRKTPDEPV